MWVRSDYILGKDQCRFKMVGIRGIENYPSDHFVLRNRLLTCPTEAGHHCHTGGLLAHMGTVYRGSEETMNYQTYSGVV